MFRWCRCWSSVLLVPSAVFNNFSDFCTDESEEHLCSYLFSNIAYFKPFGVGWVGVGGAIDARDLFGLVGELPTISYASDEPKKRIRGGR